MTSICSLVESFIHSSLWLGRVNTSSPSPNYFSSNFLSGLFLLSLTSPLDSVVGLWAKLLDYARMAEGGQLYLTENQKIIASDLLFYMQNKLHVISHDEIVKICYSFYGEDYVWQ